MTETVEIKWMLHPGVSSELASQMKWTDMKIQIKQINYTKNLYICSMKTDFYFPLKVNIFVERKANVH
jgi:hypothetical protein